MSYDLDELRRLEKEATPLTLYACGGYLTVRGPHGEPYQAVPFARAQDAAFLAALRNAAAAGMLERMAKLEDVAEAAKAHLDGSRYAPGKPDLFSALAALDALTTKEPR